MSDDIYDAMRHLQASMEVDMFYGNKDTYAKSKLARLLGKLGIKSAREWNQRYGSPGPLHMESLDATMKNITFDMKDLKQWTKIKLDED